MRPIFGHQAAVFALGHHHAGGVGIDCIITVDFPLDHIEAIRNRAGGIDTPIARRCLVTRQPQIFDAEHPWPDTPAHWLESFRRNQLRNALAHIFEDNEHCISSYHSIYGMPKTPDQNVIDVFEKLMPLVHTTLTRFIWPLHSRKPIESKSAREAEILSALRIGMSNTEIAHVTNLSQNTIKHYLTRLFERHKVLNRTQLIRLLVEQEEWRAPMVGTRIF